MGCYPDVISRDIAPHGVRNRQGGRRSGGQAEQGPILIPFKEAIQTLHQAILCGLVVSGDVFHVAAHQNERPRPVRSRPSNRQRFSRPDHGIRISGILSDRYGNMECVTFHATKLFGQ